MRYRVFDFSIESDVPFDALPHSSREPAFELRRDDAGVSGQLPAWFHTLHRPDGRPYLKVGRAPGGLVLDFCSVVVIRYAYPLLMWRPYGDAGDAALKHTLLDLALPLIASHEGRLILHAACLVVDDRAVLLAGRAGVGKSTIAAACAKGGAAIAGDDAVAVDVGKTSVICRPAYATLRLWADTRDALGYDGGDLVWEQSSKRSFPLGAVPAGPVTLRTVYVVEPAAETEQLHTIDLRRREAVMAVVPHAFVLDPEDRVRLAAHFTRLASLAARVRVRRLLVPRRFDVMPEVISLLSADLHDGVPA